MLTSKATRDHIDAGADPAAEPEVHAVNNTTGLKFNITDCKLYVPVVILSVENKLYQQLKEAFTMPVKWNKYRCQVLNQTATNNLNHLIDPAFTNVNRSFVLAFENEEDRSSFSKYCTPTIEIKDCNVLIDQKPLFEIPLKTKKIHTKQLLNWLQMVIIQQAICWIMVILALTIN